MQTSLVIRKNESGLGDTEFQRAVLGAVYMPDIVDSQGDFMVADEIRKSMWAYMAKGDNFCVDVEHDGKVTTCQVVESFIVRKGDPDFPVPGTWVVGVHIPSDELWGRVLKGDLNGFSMEGSVAKTVTDTAPKVQMVGDKRVVRGRTIVTKGDIHGHSFEVELDPVGRIVSGRTSLHTSQDGVEHFHEIRRGVVTEAADGHTHRFSTIDARLRTPDAA